MNELSHRSPTPLNFHNTLFYQSEFYDAYNRATPSDPGDLEECSDISFWLETAKDYGDRVLELGCGTGRISIPMAEAGLQVTGVDAFANMLDGARKKSDRVTWIEADIRSLNLGKTFPCIIMPYETLDLFLDLEDVEKVLACVNQHLQADGRFIFDLRHFSLRYVRDLLQDKTPRFDRVFPYPDGEGEVKVMYVEDYDFETQVYTERMIFHLPDGKEVAEDFPHRIYFPREIEAILKYNGFAIDRRFGDFDRSPFRGDSVRQILVAQLAR